MESKDGDGDGYDGNRGLTTTVIDLKTMNIEYSNEDVVLDPGNNEQGESHCLEHNRMEVEKKETVGATAITVADTGATGFIKSKPSREIYKPPSLRKTRSTYHGRSKAYAKNHSFASHEEQTIADFKNLQFLQEKNISSHEHPEPANQNLFDAAGRENSKCHPWNVNAKEFQIQTHPSHSGAQRKSNWNQHYKNQQHFQNPLHQQPEVNFRGRDFRLSQSNSSGSMFIQFQKYCYEQQQKQQQQYFDSVRQQQGTINPGQNPSENQSQPMNQSTGGLQLSKSSGNVIGKSRVRFVDNNQSGIGVQDIQVEFDTFSSPAASASTPSTVSLPLDQQFASLKIEAKGYQTTNGQPTIGKAPQLQKSKSMFYKQFEPVKLNVKGQGSWNTPSSRVPSDWSEMRNPVTLIRRSKSFGYSNTRPFYTEAVGVTGGHGHGQYTWNDFEMSKWPKGVIESVKTAINGVERVPARHKIDMVTRIFGTMLGDYNVDLVLTPDEQRSPLQGQTDFIRPAVHIFLYFIQKEKDQTVMESLLNNCLATYQSLSQQGSGMVTVSPNVTKKISRGQLLLISFSTTNKWIIFLQFLSSFYQKGKAIRLRKNDSGKCLLEDFSHHFLSLLCDSCLIVLRLSPLSYTTELMDTLFVVMTSLGSNMEKTFPWKMKQILAGVRDVLLGINSSDQSLSPYVQRTLMQLIELHAANWQLPASAVRYYYSNTTPFNQILPRNN